MAALSDLYQHLCRFKTSEWRDMVEKLAPAIHTVDRDATRIWFAFFPLDLHLDLEASADPAGRAYALGLMGRWKLAARSDSGRWPESGRRRGRRRRGTHVARRPGAAARHQRRRADDAAAGGR
jgi:hypothetical protein